MKRAGQALIALAAIALLVLLARTLPFGTAFAEAIATFRSWMQGAGGLGVAAYALAYTLATLVVGPASILSLSAGLVWGVAFGLPVVIVSATLAAVVALLVGRYLARQRVRAFVARDRRLGAIVQAVSGGGWRIVALIRLSPILPFGLQNYLLSVTEIRVLPYALATAASILPSSAVFVYVGSLGQLVDGSAELGGPARWVLLGVGLLATVLAIGEVTRRAKRTLAALADEEPGGSGRAG